MTEHFCNYKVFPLLITLEGENVSQFFKRIPTAQKTEKRHKGTHSEPATVTKLEKPVGSLVVDPDPSCC